MVGATDTAGSTSRGHDWLLGVEGPAPAGDLTIVFTDLRGSTRLYEELGEARAVDVVMRQFSVLEEAIARHDGELVKTIGDAVMAVFTQPSAALQAVLEAQQALSSPPPGLPALALRAGIHHRPVHEVVLNGRRDYFGSTVNLAARLADLSSGEDVMMSDAVRRNPGVRMLTQGAEHRLPERPEDRQPSAPAFPACPHAARRAWRLSARRRHRPLPALRAAG
jgi:class 3 adenylate cyclase